MHKINNKHIFSLFLDALNFNAEIVSKANRLTAKRGNSYFTLFESTKKIILKEYGVEYKGFEYEKVEKIYVYNIVEDMGKIKILDENKRVVLQLQSNHEILKVETTTKPKQSNNLEFIGSVDLLKYKEMQQEATLFS
jgi:hypothetical protein